MDVIDKVDFDVDAMKENNDLIHNISIADKASKNGIDFADESDSFVNQLADDTIKSVNNKGNEIIIYIEDEIYDSDGDESDFN